MQAHGLFQPFEALKQRVNSGFNQLFHGQPPDSRPVEKTAEESNDAATRPEHTIEPSETPPPHRPPGTASRIRSQRSPEERRLLPDYSNPAGAVFISDPANRRPSPTMKPKFRTGIQPMNTLSRSPYELPNQSKKNATYSKKSSPQNAHGGINGGYGQSSYILQDHWGNDRFDDGQPERKRRKTQSSLPQNASAVVVLDDEQPMPTKPILSRRNSSLSHPKPPSISSVSPHSVEANQTLTNPGPDFRMVDRPKAHSFSSGSQHSFGSRRTSANPIDPYQAANKILDPSVRSKLRHPEKVIRPTMSQLPGPFTESDDELQVLSKGADKTTTGTKSSVATRPPFKETANDAERLGKRGPETRPSTSRRLSEMFKRTTDPDSEDELQLVDATPVVAATKPTKPPLPKTHQAANSSAKRTSTHKVQSSGWTMLEVHSHGVHVRAPDLVMKYDGETRMFNVLLYDKDLQRFELKHTFEVGRANKGCKHNETQRIRLLGPRIGKERWWQDLHFAQPSDYQMFLGYLSDSVKKKVYDRTEQEVDQFFGKQPGVVNATDDASSGSHQKEMALLGPLTSKKDDTSSKSRQQEHAVPRGSLVSRLQKPSYQVEDVDDDLNTFTFAQDDAPRTTLRTTRSRADATKPKSEPPKSPVREIERYSETHGLGKPWDKPVTFGTDARRRAIVDFTDLYRLDEGEFLNDNLIEFYMLYAYSQANLAPRQVYLFNTHFFTSLARPVRGQRGINYAAVQRWTSKDDIFNYDHLVVPINEDAHWYVAIICNVSKITRTLRDSSPPDASESTSKPREKDTETGAQAGNEQQPQQSLRKSASRSNNEADILLFEGERGGARLGEETKSAAAEGAKTDTQGRPAKHEKRRSPSASPFDGSAMEKLSIEEDLAGGQLLKSEAPLAAADSKKKAKRKPGPRHDPAEPMIIILDSLGAPHGKTVRFLKEYIYEEGKSKRNIDARITGSNTTKEIPLQENYCDCGLFLLSYLEKFFSNPDEFVAKVLQREMDVEVDWPDLDASFMRGRIRSLLFTLAEEQQAERRKHRAEKKVTADKPKLSPSTVPSTVANGSSLPAMQAQNQLEAPKDEASQKEAASTKEQPAPKEAAAPKEQVSTKEYAAPKEDALPRGGSPVRHGRRKVIIQPPASQVQKPREPSPKRVLHPPQLKATAGPEADEEENEIIEIKDSQPESQSQGPKPRSPQLRRDPSEDLSEIPDSQPPSPKVSSAPTVIHGSDKSSWFEQLNFASEGDPSPKRPTSEKKRAHKVSIDVDAKSPPETVCTPERLVGEHPIPQSITNRTITYGGVSSSEIKRTPKRPTDRLPDPRSEKRRAVEVDGSPIREEKPTHKKSDDGGLIPAPPEKQVVELDEDLYPAIKRTPKRSRGDPITYSNKKRTPNHSSLAAPFAALAADSPTRQRQGPFFEEDPRPPTRGKFG